MKLIFLSLTIKQYIPLYPGDPLTKIEEAGNLEKDGFVAHYISMLTHAGTHIDAPSHMIDNGKTLDQFPLETFSVRGVCIKIKNKQFDLAAIKTVTIQKDDIILLNIGMQDSYGKSEYFETYPAIPQDVAE